MSGADGGGGDDHDGFDGGRLHSGNWRPQRLKVRGRLRFVGAAHLQNGGSAREIRTAVSPTPPFGGGRGRSAGYHVRGRRGGRA